MFVKLAAFGLGYLLGTKAGRDRYQELVAGAKDVVRGEEVASVVGFVRGSLWILRQRGRGVGIDIGRRAP